MSDEFWQALIEKNVFIRVTKYPIEVDYKKILKKAAEHGRLNSNLNSHGPFSKQKENMIKYKNFHVSENDYIELHKVSNCHEITNFYQIGCHFAITAILNPAIVVKTKLNGKNLPKILVNTCGINKF